MAAPILKQDVEKEGNLTHLAHVDMPSLLVGTGTQSWLASFIFHCALLVVMALTLGTVQVVNKVVNAPISISAQAVPQQDVEFARLEVGYTPPDPSILTTDTLTWEKSPAVQEQFHDTRPVFEAPGKSALSFTVGEGGSGGFASLSKALGPSANIAGDTFGEGGGSVAGDGQGVGNESFGKRGMRKAVAGGATKQSERAVAAALNWLARHQNSNGSWSLDHRGCCRSCVCSGAGDVNSDAGATALGLLPFLAAGQTHQNRGPYQKNIQSAISWLIQNQRPSGDLSGGGASQMYAHGLATIALCEAYGMTQDSRVGYAAQAGINFIQSGQNQQGSWRYTHGSDDSDTSVFGWQVMALKSGQMAGLHVKPEAIDRARHFLSLVATGGRYKELFGYTPGGGSTLSMTSAGLLTTQYLGAGRNDPQIVGGIEYLSKHQPNSDQRNVYYWYYASQVLHNSSGPEWDHWNRNVRRILISTQETSGCETGSWSPDKPTLDPWGRQGGRLMCTSLSCLTLEVYYRYLPIYKMDARNIESELNNLEKASSQK